MLFLFNLLWEFFWGVGVSESESIDKPSNYGRFSFFWAVTRPLVGTVGQKPSIVKAETRKLVRQIVQKLNNSPQEWENDVCLDLFYGIITSGISRILGLPAAKRC